MSRNAVLSVRGPEALPDAAMMLLDNQELDMLRVRDFMPASIISGLIEITRGVERKSGTAPHIDEYGPAAAEALNETASRAQDWVRKQGFHGLIPIEGGFISDKLSYGRWGFHMDKIDIHDRMSGPLFASIGLTGYGLYFVSRGMSVIDREGNYSPNLHFSYGSSVNLEYWLAHRDLFSKMVQKPRDLIMFTGIPEPSAHAVPMVTPNRKAAIHELGYVLPAEVKKYSRRSSRSPVHAINITTI